MTEENDRMMPTENVRLSKEALRLLKRVTIEENIGWEYLENHEHSGSIIYYNLVIPSRTGQYIHLHPRGEQILLRYDEEQKNRRGEHAHNWRIAVFSTFVGALLSKPIWAGLEWLIKWLAEIL